MEAFPAAWVCAVLVLANSTYSKIQVLKFYCLPSKVKSTAGMRTCKDAAHSCSLGNPLENNKLGVGLYLSPQTHLLPLTAGSVGAGDP